MSVLLSETRPRAARLFVSHRLSALREASSISVLVDGRIVEHGSHRDLMQRGGLYETMFRRQAAGYAVEPLQAP